MPFPQGQCCRSAGPAAGAFASPNGLGHGHRNHPQRRPIGPEHEPSGAQDDVASNVTNVNTPEYVRKVVHQETAVLGSTTAGVKVGEIRRIVDLFLEREVRIAAADSNRYVAMSLIHDRLQSFLGSPDDNSTFPGRLDQAFSSLAAIVAEPDSAVRRLGFVDDLQSFADEIKRVSENIQLLRAKADRRIGESVDAVNAAILRIHHINPRIATLKAEGNDSSALEEQHAQAISEISDLVDIRTFEIANGFSSIVTSTGIVLLDTVARKLVYDPAGVLSPATRFSEITVNKIDPATGVTATREESLDRNIASGALRGYIDMRNTELPNLSLALGEYGRQIMDQFNAVHNDNSTVPTPTSLTGRASGLVAADAHGFTGTATFAVTDSTSQVTKRIDIDFTNNTINIDSGGANPLSGTTLGDVVDDINTALGAGRSFTLSSTGAIAFSTTKSGEGVVIQQCTTASSRAGRGFSHCFGMNDLLESFAESHYDTGFATTDLHRFGSSGIVTI